MTTEKEIPTDMKEAYEQNVEYPYAMGRIRVRATSKTDDPEERLEAIKEVLEELDEVKEEGETNE